MVTGCAGQPVVQGNSFWPQRTRELVMTGIPSAPRPAASEAPLPTQAAPILTTVWGDVEGSRGASLCGSDPAEEVKQMWGHQ